LNVKTRLIDKNGDFIPIDIRTNEIVIKDQLLNSDDIQMVNRISKVELLGSFLRKGEFKNFFNLVGIINQSDPNQVYLKSAEIIFKMRYIENQKLNEAYSLLKSQILQKKINEAEETINLILKSDKMNSNAHLAKSIINIYLLDKKDSRYSLTETKNLEISPENNEILNEVERLVYLLELQFVNAYKSFLL
tara:strand:+ start:42 stop:614 length:573 start_codon:yes stop_codon:yes gene_type:complete